MTHALLEAIFFDEPVAAAPRDPDPDDDPSEPAEDQWRRLDAGNALLARAKRIDTSAVSKLLAAFTKEQRALRMRNTAFMRAREGEGSAREVLARRHADLERALHALARALAARGAPRATPFYRFGFSTPSDLTETPTLRRPADLALRLVHAVRGTLDTTLEPELSTLESAARLTIAAATTLLRRSLSRTNEGRLLMDHAQDWDLAHLSLKRRTRALPKLHAALFGDPVTPRTP